ncbi:MAG: hypothetical protein J7556_04135 [Acidovorax sp.]|nr:hypothetical protein [Acidovorax sp.]
MSLVTHDASTSRLSFLTSDGLVLVSILPCEPCMPEVDTCVAKACVPLVTGT